MLCYKEWKFVKDWSYDTHSKRLATDSQGPLPRRRPTAGTGDASSHQGTGERGSTLSAGAFSRAHHDSSVHSLPGP